MSREGPPGRCRLVSSGLVAVAEATLLDAVASSLVTVTSLTSSSPVVTLELARGELSPRRLRTFTSDERVESALARRATETIPGEPVVS